MLRSTIHNLLRYFVDKSSQTGLEISCFWVMDFQGCFSQLLLQGLWVRCSLPVSQESAFYLPWRPTAFTHILCALLVPSSSFLTSSVWPFFIHSCLSDPQTLYKRIKTFELCEWSNHWQQLWFKILILEIDIERKVELKISSVIIQFKSF